MQMKKLKTKLAKAIRIKYHLSFIESLTAADAFLRDKRDKLDYQIYDDEVETVYFSKDKQGNKVTISYQEVEQLIETIEKTHRHNRPPIYHCFACRKTYQSEKKAVKCCTVVAEEENGDRYMPRKINSNKPVSSTHRCPQMRHGGKTWTTWLADGETCPMCRYTYNPR